MGGAFITGGWEGKERVRGDSMCLLFIHSPNAHLTPLCFQTLWGCQVDTNQQKSHGFCTHGAYVLRGGGLRSNTQMDAKIAVEVVLGMKGTAPRKVDNKPLDLVRVVSKSFLELPVAGETGVPEAGT